jgi:hypothetical protein
LTLANDQNVYREMLRNDIQTVILNSGKSEGSDDVVLTNTLVIETLLDMVAAYAAMHSFNGYTSQDLVFKYSTDLTRKIEAYRTSIAKGTQFKIVPRDEVH